MYRANSVRALLICFSSIFSIQAIAQAAPVAQAPATTTAQQKPSHKQKKTTTTSPSQPDLDDVIEKPKDNPTKPNLPKCSTEVANGNCFVNINRRYPYSYPGLMMKPGASVTVQVFNPFGFEKLTLEPSAPATIYQSTDQFGTLFSSIAPGLKGTNINAASISTATHLNDFAERDASVNFLGPGNVLLQNQQPTPVEQQINQAENDLNQLLTAAVDKYIRPYETFREQTNEIYRQVRLASLAVPRPALDNPDQTKIDQTVFKLSRPDGVADCSVPTDPWHSYDRWRGCMLQDLLIQGDSGTTLWKLFPLKCANPSTPTGPWTLPVPLCSTKPDGNGGATFDTSTPVPPDAPHIAPAYDDQYTALIALLAPLANPQDPTLPKDPNNLIHVGLFKRANAIKSRHDLITNFLSGIMGAVPTVLAKISTDMQNFYVALLNASDVRQGTVTLGTLYGPSVLSSADKKERKYLGIPVGLAPTITYNVTAQNLITNSLLSAPATTQRTLIAAIPLTYAEPRFETSTGVLLSWLHNRTFANTTQVCINAPGATQPTPPTAPTVVCTPPPAGTAGVPTQQSVVISQTETNRPLFIPYYAAHYRLFPEWKWGRRVAFYGTGALAINPYLTDLEYAAGFSLSWRYLIFSPVYHLGRSTHLTQGEQVGQIWCNYGGTSTATSVPP